MGFSRSFPLLDPPPPFEGLEQTTLLDVIKSIWLRESTWGILGEVLVWVGRWFFSGGLGGGGGADVGPFCSS